jgi:hypothetical protein
MLLTHTSGKNPDVTEGGGAVGKGESGAKSRRVARGLCSAASPAGSSAGEVKVEVEVKRSSTGAKSRRVERWSSGGFAARQVPPGRAREKT